MELRGKKVLVVGAGKTGIALVKFLLDRGARVTLNDKKTPPDLSPFTNLPVETVWGNHPESLFSASDLILLSPGVPLHLPPVQKAMAAGIPVLGELGLASRFVHLPTIAITGTNGKTTTTTLVGTMLENAGMKPFVGGNIGRPLIEIHNTFQNYRWAVLEVSSFQLATAPDFQPRIAAILNIEPDHLDWHVSFEAYQQAKWSIAKNMGAKDTLVLPASLRDQKPAGVSASVLTFSLFNDSTCAAFANPSGLCWQFGSETFEVPYRDLTLHSPHLLQDMLAAGLLSKIAGVPSDVIKKTLRDFKGLPHRMEMIREINGIRFINDSKATNVDAVYWALRALPPRIIWLAGGLWKGGDLSTLIPEVKAKVKALIAFGSSAGRFRQTFQPLTKTLEVETLPEALETAVDQAASGDTVLLSPACASFDQFKNYKERGTIFASLVNALPPLVGETSHVPA